MFWLTTLAVATATAGGTGSLVQEAHRRADAWGPSRRVAVATRDLEVGAVLSGDDVRFEELPRKLMPAGTIDDGVRVDGRVVVARIVRGEPVIAARLAPDGVHGLTALLSPGQVAVLIPSGVRPPRVAVGERVDLYTAAGRSAGVGSAGDAMAQAATVLAVGDDGGVTVAVQRSEVPAVASAILDGSMVVAVSGP